jgi:hypothetical protein
VTADAPTAPPVFDQATLDAAANAVMELMPRTRFSSDAAWVKRSAAAVRALGQVA